MLGSLYTGTSGINANGRALEVIGDNIANLGTVGFKSNRINFGDVLGSTLTSGAGTSQVGRGVLVSGTDAAFSQGAFETTYDVLDMAIDGDGFFIVASDDGSKYYTRAGNFSLDKDGLMVNPDGMKVQGFLYNEGAGNFIGSPQDISVGGSTKTSSKDTDNMSMASNLDVNETTVATVTLDTITFAANVLEPEFDGAGGAWIQADYDAGLDTADTATYNDTIQATVTDSRGVSRNIDIYYRHDPSTGIWDWHAYVPAAHSASGLLEQQATGSLTFDGAGVLLTGSPATGQFNFAGGAAPGQSVTLDSSAMLQDIVAGDFGDVTAAATYADGSSGFDVNNAIATSNFSTAITVYDAVGNPSLITTYFTKTNNNQWAWNAVMNNVVQETGTFEFDNSGTLTTINSTQVVATAGYTVTGTFAFASGNQPITLDFNGFSQLATASQTTAQSQDGYPVGDLTGLTVSQGGIISGIYSNGQVKSIARLALQRFDAPGELVKNGRNLFSVSYGSGTGVEGVAGQSGLGRVMSNSLEISNVDLAKEFVNMISAQRGFQANARVISASDNVLQELVNLVR